MLVAAWKLWVFRKLQSRLCFCVQSELGSNPATALPTQWPPPFRALAGSEWVGRGTLAAIDASSFLFEGSDAAADEGYFIY